MTPKINFCSTAISLLIVSSLARANSYYLEIPQDNLCEFGTGWANYCTPSLVIEETPEPKKPKPNITIIQSTPTEAPKDPSDPLVWLDDYQKGERRARARMVMEPTQENVDAYRREYFNDTMDRSTLVSDYWRRSAWQNPENDYTLKRPTGYLSKREHDLRRNERIEQTVESLSERYGIFFVFKSDDHQSIKFAPVLDDFATQHNLHVQGISIDGQPLSTWSRPWQKQKNQILKRLNLNSDYTPAIALFDRQTKKAIPIGFGILAHDELANRLYVLTRLKPGEDY